MQTNSIFSLICTILLCALYLFVRYRSVCIGDNSLYPELIVFTSTDNQKLITKDLFDAMREPRWVNIKSLYDIVSNPTIKTGRSVSRNLRNFYVNLFDTNDRAIKYYMFMVKAVVIKENIGVCLNTVILVNGVANVSSAGFMCILPRTVSNVIPPVYSKISRIYIPIMASDDTGIILDQDAITWSNLKDGYVIVGNCQYRLWNHTNLNKYLLFIDVYV